MKGDQGKKLVATGTSNFVCIWSKLPWIQEEKQELFVVYRRCYYFGYSHKNFENAFKELCSEFGRTVAYIFLVYVTD